MRLFTANSMEAAIFQFKKIRKSNRKDGRRDRNMEKSPLSDFSRWGLNRYKPSSTNFFSVI